MLSVSSYLSKTIISIYEASVVGTIVSANFDKKMRRICSFIAVEDKDDYREYIIPINRIVTQDNAITIKNRNSVKFYEKSNIYVKCPINLPVYSSCGRYQGIVKDVTFDENTFEVIDLILKEANVNISACEIASVSESLVITKGEGFTKLQPPRRRRDKQPQFIDEIELIEEIPQLIEEYEKITKDVLSIENELCDDSDEDEICSCDWSSNIPARIISDYSFLLNRYVLADVYSTTGDLIIMANSKITERIVDVARRHGKLVELTVGSRLANNE